MSIKTIDLHFMWTPGAIAVYLLETSEGPILFESGPYSCHQRLKAELNRIGYQIEDIKHVVLTHIHLDHAGGAWAFAEKGAKIYVHEYGAKHLLAPSKLIESATKIYADQMDTLWGKLMPIDKEQLVIVEHGAEFNFGNESIRALYTPGHAIHHIAWNTVHGIVCGDVAGIRIKKGPPMPPCPPPDINFDHWRNSLDVLLAENPEQIYISHFGEYDNAALHLQNLKSEIDLWDEYAYSLYQDNPNPMQALGPFTEWIESRFKALDESDEVLGKYNIANPPWMSIHGIFRYYSKRNTV